MTNVIIVGWGRDSRNEGFGAQGGIKYQLVTLVTSVQTLLRGMICTVIVLSFLLIERLFQFCSASNDSECDSHCI